MASPVSFDSESASCATPHEGAAIVAAMALVVPGSLSVVAALEGTVVSVPAGRGSPGQIALLETMGATVLDEVHVTPGGVVPSNSMVPVEKAPAESATPPPSAAQASPPPAASVAAATTALPSAAGTRHRRATLHPPDPAARCRRPMTP